MNRERETTRLVKILSRIGANDVRIFFKDLKERDETKELLEKIGYSVKYVGKDCHEKIYSGIEIKYQEKKK